LQTRRTICSFFLSVDVVEEEDEDEDEEEEEEEEEEGTRKS
jgi:hypothetical protein